MKIEIYKDGKLYDCEIVQHDIGDWRVRCKSENIKDIDFNIEQNECGFTDKIEIYLK